MDFQVIIITWCLNWVRVNCLPDYVHLHTESEMMETKLINRDQPNACRGVDLLIVIKTSLHHFEYRRLMRDNWIKPTNYTINRLFVIGQSRDINLIARIKNEVSTNHDFLIGQFVDNYYNLTLKTTFIINWLSIHCRDNWIFITDDDVILNERLIVEFTKSNPKSLNRNKIFGEKWSGIAPLRDLSQKWSVSYSNYPFIIYPDYVSGNGYLMTSSTAKQLANHIYDPTLIRLYLEDVFLTALVATKAGVDRVHVNAFSYYWFYHIDLRALFESSWLIRQIESVESINYYWKVINGESIDWWRIDCVTISFFAIIAIYKLVGFRRCRRTVRNLI